MRRIVLNCMGLLLVAGVVLSGSASAQEKPSKPDATYKLEFSIYEVENGKRLNARKYMTTADEGVWGRIRVGSQVPLVVGTNQFQYKDVGVKIDCRPHSRDNGVRLDFTVEMTSVLRPEESHQSIEHPVFRTDSSEVDGANLPLGKPTVVSTMDDVGSNRRYEIEVTATKVKEG